MNSPNSSNDYRNYDISEYRDRLIRSLKQERVLKSKIIEEAIIAIPREKFLWEGTPEFLAYADEPQPLGETGQTISAPHMVVIMLEELKLERGMNVLEIGTGSGYNAALLAWIVSEKNRGESAGRLVVSIERDERLAEFATKNIRSVGLSDEVKIIMGDGSLGYPQGSEEEIYDRIVVTAGAPRVPSFLKKQLKTGGIIEIPVGGATYQKLILVKKIKSGHTTSFKEERIVDCSFVPLIGQDAYALN